MTRSAPDAIQIARTIYEAEFEDDFDNLNPKGIEYAFALQKARAVLSLFAAAPPPPVSDAERCFDCPPSSYSADATRCASCPDRARKP